MIFFFLTSIRLICVLDDDDGICFSPTEACAVEWALKRLTILFIFGGRRICRWVHDERIATVVGVGWMSTAAV